MPQVTWWRRLRDLLTSAYADGNLLIRRKSEALVLLHLIMIGVALLYALSFIVVGTMIRDVYLVLGLAGMLVVNLLVLRSGNYALTVTVILLVAFLGLSSAVLDDPKPNQLRLYSLGIYHLFCLLLAGLVGDRAWYSLALGVLSTIMISWFMYFRILPQEPSLAVDAWDSYISTIALIVLGTAVSLVLNRQMARAFDEISSLNETLEEKVKHRTAELEKSQTKLIESEKLAALGGMVGGLSHEINTPLGNSVTAHSYFRETLERVRDEALSGELDDERLREFFEKAESVGDIVERNLLVATGLLNTFKKVSADLHDADLRPIRVAEDVNTVIRSNRAHLRGRRTIAIESEGPSDLQVIGNPGLLWQVLTNLVMNAITHAFPDGDGVVKIAYWVEREGLSLSVADNGIGMDDETRKRMYEPFFTTKRGQGGTGLGLNIVYNLVMRVGGTIECESAVGKGTIVTLWMPWPEV